MQKTLMELSKIAYLSSIGKSDGVIHFNAAYDEGMERSFIFSDFKTAYAMRKKFVNRLIKIFGPENLLLPEGLDGEMGIAHAIMDISDPIEKDSFLAFTVFLSPGNIPLCFVSAKDSRSEAYYQWLFGILEARRRDISLNGVACG